MIDALKKILEDVDTDIKEHLLAKSGKYHNWELLGDPCITALLWQIVRDNKNAHGAR